VEKQHKFGSLHAAARKPGKVKGLERITTAFGKVVENYLPPSFIEVSPFMYFLFAGHLDFLRLMLVLMEQEWSDGRMIDDIPYVFSCSALWVMLNMSIYSGL